MFFRFIKINIFINFLIILNKTIKKKTEKYIMKYTELIDKCIECIQTFNQVISSVDTHSEKFIKKVEFKY